MREVVERKIINSWEVPTYHHRGREERESEKIIFCFEPTSIKRQTSTSSMGCLTSKPAVIHTNIPQSRLISQTDTRIVPSISGGTVIFEAANGYGISAQNQHGRPKEVGDQLENERIHNDMFIINHIGDNLITIESMTVPGLYIGVGQTSYNFSDTRPFEAILVDRNISGEADILLKVIASKNGSNDYISIEALFKPGFYLNHCGGYIYFSNCKNGYGVTNEEHKDGSSWKLEYTTVIANDVGRIGYIETSAEEAVEDEAMELPVVGVNQSIYSEEECPICFEEWEGKIRVMARCKHEFCIKCMADTCKRTTPSSEGECPLCCNSIRMSSLRRVTLRDIPSP